MDSARFIEVFPRLYHMAHKDALPSILKHGLLCTSALLDLYEVDMPVRSPIERAMRRESIAIHHKKWGSAVIRDQKPIVNDSRLQASLIDGTKVQDFHLLLNSMVFFWVSPLRLQGLRNATAYRGEPQLVLTLNTESIVAANESKVRLCPMNSGACRPIAHPRSAQMFQKISEYDFEFWRRRKGGAEKAVVECTVVAGVTDIKRHIVETELVVPEP